MIKQEYTPYLLTVMQAEEKLIREFIRESIRTGSSDYLVLEYTPGAAGASFRRGVSDAASKLGKVVKGELGNISASIKQLTGISLQAVKEVVSLGFFKADYEGIKERYKKDLEKIDAKYGREIEEARGTFAKAMSPLTAAAKLGLGTTAAAIFFINPITFIGTAAVASGGKDVIKKKVSPAALVAVAAAKSGLDKLDNKGRPFGRLGEDDEEDEDKGESSEPKIPDWAKQAQSDVRNTITEYSNEIKQRVNSIMSVKNLDDLTKIKDFGVDRNDLVKYKKEQKTPEQQTGFVKAMKAGALQAIMVTVKADRNRQLAEGKKIFPRVSDEMLTGPGSYIGAYDKIITMIQEKIKSL